MYVSPTCSTWNSDVLVFCSMTTKQCRPGSTQPGYQSWAKASWSWPRPWYTMTYSFTGNHMRLRDWRKDFTLSPGPDKIIWLPLDSGMLEHSFPFFPLVSWLPLQLSFMRNWASATGGNRRKLCKKSCFQQSQIQCPKIYNKYSSSTKFGKNPVLVRHQSIIFCDTNKTKTKNGELN